MAGNILLSLAIAEELLALLKREYPAAHLEPTPKPFPPKVVKWTRSFQEHLQTIGLV
jgi:hypothetical protein